MVLQEQLCSDHGGYQRHGYMQVEDHHSPNHAYGNKEHYPKYGYGRKEEYDAYHSGSSIHTRPNPCITTPKPPNHHMIGLEGYKQHGNGWYSQAQNHHGYDLHGYGKYSNGMHHGSSGVGHESLSGSYTHTEPNRYESMSYKYYGEAGHDRSPPYYDHHEDHKTFGAKGAEWIAKGIDD